MIYDVILFWPLLDQVPAMSYIHHIASDQVPAPRSCHHKYQKKMLRKIAPLQLERQCFIYLFGFEKNSWII